MILHYLKVRLCAGEDEMKLMDRKNGIAISETANPVGDSRLQAFGSGQQNLPLEDFEGKILRIAFYKFPSSSPKTFHFVQFLNKIDLSIYLVLHAFLWDKNNNI